jgi:hypothetical protein
VCGVMLPLAGIEVNLVFGLVCTLRPNPPLGAASDRQEATAGA